MKYEAKVDLRNANTSHALLVELVGREKRVLDVGCASGYLGEALKQRGCTVAGVEYDAEAADAAKAVLDQVVVGDITELDLVGHFGEGSFDAVVFGDVLEHVVDPAAVLRATRPLLAPGGSVAISIPNVAHGAVRLSLLRGRFEYRPLGLLDETHLRFFTRDTLRDLLDEGGFVAVDMRRTVAGVFDTEVAVRREDFDERVVEAVEDDPDATTYQFVFRAVPRDEAATAATAAAVAEPDASLLRAPACRIGIWASCSPNDPLSALALRVTRAELETRLPDASFRVFSARGYLDQSPHTGGEPVEPLGELSPERLDELAGHLDCLVLAGDTPAEAPGKSLDRGPEGRCPVLWSAVTAPADPEALAAAGDLAYAAVLGTPGTPAADAAGEAGVATVPDPLVLAPRALRSEALARRLEFLRVMGWFPRYEEAVVVEVDAEMARRSEAVAAALREVSGPGTAVVLVQLDPADAEAGLAADELAAAIPAHRVPAGAVVDDVVAAIANAAVVAASTPSGLHLALAYERPSAAVDLSGSSAVAEVARSLLGTDHVLAEPGALAGLRDAAPFRPGPDAVARLRAALDRHFDRVATIADGAAAARPRVAEIGPLLPPHHYVAALETAHRRMQRSLDAERGAVADHLNGVRARHQAELDLVRRALADLDAAGADRAAELEERLADRESEVARLRDVEERLVDREREVARLRDVEDRLAGELQALLDTRTMRLLRPLRTVYGTLRRNLR